MRATSCPVPASSTRPSQTLKIRPERITVLVQRKRTRAAGAMELTFELDRQHPAAGRHQGRGGEDEPHAPFRHFLDRDADRRQHARARDGFRDLALVHRPLRQFLAASRRVP